MYHSPVYFKLMADPQVQAEAALLELTESICKKYGPYRGRYKLLYWLLEWTADKLIWR